MSEVTNEYDDPEIQAVIRRKARARMSTEANAQLIGRRHGEVAYLRNAAKNIDLALSEYDKLATPPAIAHELSATYDSIMLRLTEMGEKAAKDAATAAAAAGKK
jgi:hypothetical protein